MAEKLLIAKYKDLIIHLSDYQKSIHHDNIYCPFCDPPLKVTYNVKGFFMAWRNMGGHHCGRALAQYFDADWEGKKYVEWNGSVGEHKKVVIDIEALTRVNPPKERISKNSPKAILNEGTYNSSKEKVFRDVIRSIYQMKKMIEANSMQSLSKLEFSFRLSSQEILSIDELVFPCHGIHKVPHGKRRFIIFKVNKVVTSGDKAFINSYIIDGYEVTAILRYPTANIKNLLEFEDKYVIAYGVVKPAKNKPKKKFLELNHDFHMEILSESCGKDFFANCRLEKFTLTAQTLVTTKEINLIKEIDHPKPLNDILLISEEKETQQPQLNYEDMDKIKFNISTSHQQKDDRNLETAHANNGVKRISNILKDSKSIIDPHLKQESYVENKIGRIRNFLKKLGF
ncbi:hypothetical protein MKY24_19220 [Paenibacillus sp. FSL P2-0322]|uniref:hypothetical protein n=1 Tax=Paenibacillus sp. FSL P2-0322 TaxID=2921628 RepID=UPI0030CFF715